MTMSWTGRRLDSLTNNGTTNSYLYNADGIRTRKIVGGVTTDYFLNGSTILAEQTGSNVIWYIYDGNGEILGFTYNGTSYYYLKNQQGDVLSIVDASNNVVGNYTYDAWGKVLSATGSMAQINPIRYRSYYYDTVTGFYYLQSRYYDPKVGRFINADDTAFLGATGTILSYNLFAYCENNPMNYSDPSGHIAANVVGAIVGGVIGAVGGYLLTRWLADKLNLSGWKRNVFIWGLTAVITASAAAIGYFVGPYVAKAWNYLGAKLAVLVKQSCKSIGSIASNTMSKIRATKHLWSKVLGKQATDTNIKSLIYKAISKGEWKYQTDGIIRIVLKYKSEYIVLTGKVVNQAFRIGDAWIWDRISNLWGSAR